MSVRKLLIASVIATGTLLAATGVQAQTLSCDDIQFTGRILSQMPNAKNYCLEVVPKNGENYAHFVAEFVRRSGSDVVLRFKDRSGGFHDPITISPPDGQRINVNGRNLRIRDLQRGDELDIYLPPDRWVAILQDSNEEFVAATEVVEYEIMDAPAETTSSTLPSTASPMPLIGLLGGLFTFLGAGGLLAFRSRKA